MRKILGRRDRVTAGRVMTGLFLRRLIDNDIISPHADRSETLAVLYGFVVSLAIFATFFVSTDYLAAFIQLPGPTALSALSDRFLFIAASMAISGLATLMVWDALALESRDAAILGPLPIPLRTITRAKLAAAVAFGAVLALALNIVPSVLYPVFLTLNLRGVRGAGLLGLIAGHAISVFMAGLFGFFGVLSVRGVLRLLTGERAFRRISSVTQSALVVCTVTALLLAPTVRRPDVPNWVADVKTTRWAIRPVTWFLGLNETLAGHIVADAPVVLPPRFSFVEFPRTQDEADRSVYRRLAPRLAALARTAWLSVVLAAGIGIATFLWSNRRMPDQSTAAVDRSRIRIAVRRLLRWLTRGNPEAQAGFFFTWQTLTRSAPHRTIVAIAIAAGCTHLLMTLTASGLHADDLRSMPLGLFAIQIAVLVPLMTAFRYAVTVPPELGANWAIRMAWGGDERNYLAGVKRAALVTFAIVPSLVLLPLNIALFGAGIAVAHSLYGLLVATATLEALFLGYRKFPFACSYVPIENPKLVWPIGLAVVLIGTYGIADVERVALQDSLRAAGLGAAFSVIVLLVGLVDRAQRRERRSVNFDERPAPATQRLGLFERAAIRD